MTTTPSEAACGASWFVGVAAWPCPPSLRRPSDRPGATRIARHAHVRTEFGGDGDRTRSGGDPHRPVPSRVPGGYQPVRTQHRCAHPTEVHVRPWEAVRRESARLD